MNNPSLFLLSALLSGAPVLAQSQGSVSAAGPSAPAIATPQATIPLASPGVGGASQTPAAATVSTAPANVAPDYVIGPSDTLAVTVFKEPTMSGTLPVRPDGMISLSLVGDLQASGLTPMKLSDEIRDRLRKFINDPSVTVTVMAVNSKHIYILGEVGKPGELPFTPGLDPLQAIASVGGLGPYANPKHVYILRKVNGKPIKIPFDYKKAIKSGDTQGVTLTAGDTVVVPE